MSGDDGKYAEENRRWRRILQTPGGAEKLHKAQAEIERTWPKKPPDPNWQAFLNAIRRRR